MDGNEKQNYHPENRELDFVPLKPGDSLIPQQMGINTRRIMGIPLTKTGPFFYDNILQTTLTRATSAGLLYQSQRTGPTSVRKLNGLKGKAAAVAEHSPHTIEII